MNVFMRVWFGGVEDADDWRRINEKILAAAMVVRFGGTMFNTSRGLCFAFISALYLFIIYAENVLSQQMNKHTGEMQQSTQKRMYSVCGGHSEQRKKNEHRPVHGKEIKLIFVLFN